MILIFCVLISSENQFPPVKFTKNGIFGWFNALSLLKKPFNNSNIFGFRSNASEPDLSMIVSDIIDYLHMHDLNISDKIEDSINKQDDNGTVSSLYLLSDEECMGRSGNVQQFCKVFNVNLKFEKIGISEDNIDILIANIVGFLPTNLFFLILAIVAVVYYIIQMILSCKYCKPSETAPPSCFTFILFYAADCLVFISAILFICSFSGVDDFYSTLTSLDTVIPRITYSIASSLNSLFEEGIPNSLDPIFQIIIDILNSTQVFLNSASFSFLNPTQIFLQKMSSSNESDMGVFALYNEKIQPKANEFYEKAQNFPNLSNISKFFFKQNFSSYQKQFEDLYYSELKLSQQLDLLVSFFEYTNSILQPWQKSIFSMINNTVGDSNMTLGELFDDLKEQSLSSFELLSELRKNAKEKSALWKGLVSIFFIFGILFLLSPVLFGFVFMMKGSCAICVANTAAVFPLISTIIMFLFSFFLTGIGFALVSLSNQLEQRVDGFISESIDHLFPGREIIIPPINITYHTNGVYKGVLTLSKIVFPSTMDNFERFVTSDEETGFASSLHLNEIIDLSKYGNEIGDFIAQLSDNFTFPESFLLSLRGVQYCLSLLKILPKKIDGFFNWGVPMTMSTQHLREQIKEMDPSALVELEPYLLEIDNYSDIMNSQFKIAMEQLSDILPQSLSNLNQLVANYMKNVMDDLSKSIRVLMRKVYPVIDSIQSGLLIGPYALIRNTLFYDLASSFAFMSASGTLMIPGLVAIVTLLWIRRKYMKNDTDSKCFSFFELQCGKGKVNNSSVENSSSSKNSNMPSRSDRNYATETTPKGRVMSMDDEYDIYDISNDYAPSTKSDDYSCNFYAGSLRSMNSTT